MGTFLGVRIEGGCSAGVYEAADLLGGVYDDLRMISRRLHLKVVRGGLVFL